MTLAHTCATCVWWNRTGPRLASATRDPSSPADTGTCQKHAPVVVQGNASFPVSLFPVTHESRFCGEWKPADTGNGDGGERVIAFPRLAEAA